MTTRIAVFVEVVFRMTRGARDEREVEQRREGELREHAEQAAARVRQHERRPHAERRGGVHGQALAPTPFAYQQAEREAERHLREEREVVAVDELREAADVRGEPRRDERQRLLRRRLPEEAEERAQTSDGDDRED